MECPDNQSSRDFSNSQLKPEPLRIARKNRLSNASSCDRLPSSSSKHSGTAEWATEIEERQGDALAQHVTVTSHSELVRRDGLSSLAALVSRFETLDALSCTTTSHQTVTAVVASRSLTNPSRNPVGSRATFTATRVLERKTGKENIELERSCGLDGHTDTSED